jgi:predicted DNA-binding transcriptional regulator AlpA
MSDHARPDAGRLVAPKDLAARWSISKSTLRRWSRQGRGPQPIRLSDRSVRYALADVLAHERTRGESR